MSLPRFMSKHVLIVDDSLASRNGISRLLKSFGFTTVEVEDGYNAIWLLKQCQKFDLVTLDYHMPRMDGVAVARWIRNQPRLTELPILMITTDTSKVFEAVEIGITEFLGKPIDRESLAMTLNRMMDLSLDSEAP